MPKTKRKYDPVKRREYYLRTRELKGRKKSISRKEDILKTDAERQNRDAMSRREDHSNLDFERYRRNSESGKFAIARKVIQKQLDSLSKEMDSKVTEIEKLRNTPSTTSFGNLKRVIKIDRLEKDLRELDKEYGKLANKEDELRKKEWKIQDKEISDYHRK